MPLEFHEPNDWAMVVMDGRKAVAKARRYPVGYWLLKLENASWTDPRARQPLRDDFPPGFEDLFSRYPNMLAVKTKREARSMMRGLAERTPLPAAKRRESRPAGMTGPA